MFFLFSGVCVVCFSRFLLGTWAETDLDVDCEPHKKAGREVKDRGHPGVVSLATHRSPHA